jgi:CRP-like cAMP-binding protein
MHFEARSMSGSHTERCMANALLRRFPASARDTIGPHCEHLHLSAGTVLHKADTRLEGIYFPTRSLISMRKRLRDGETIEIASVGSEGMIGVDALLAEEGACYEAVVQIPGPAIRVPTPALRHAMAASRELKDLVLDYVSVLLDGIAQTVACNRLHTIEQRCCRWLLARSDSTGTETIPLTHADLALWLGVRRPGLTSALGRLQRTGLIAQHRGGITVLDRPRLEATACECYEFGRDSHLRMFGGGPTPPDPLFGGLMVRFRTDIRVSHR